MYRRQVRVWLAVGVALAAVVAHGPVAAKRPRHVVQELADRGVVDWTRGVVLGVGSAGADLRAPTPTVARIGAERVARERARAQLLTHARGLAAATGGSVGELVDADAGARERLQRAVERALDAHVDYGSDGSVVVTLALPLEAVRSAVHGAMAPPTGDGPTAVVVDARRVMTAPALGVRVAGYAGPVVFHRDARAAQRDTRAGAQVVRVKASTYEDGVVTVDGEVAWASNPLVLLVVGKR